MAESLFMIKNIQASYADKWFLKQRDPLGNLKHTSIGGVKGVVVLLLPEDLASAELCLCSIVAQKF